MKIIDNYQRKGLAEGRSFGMGFSLALKNKDSYEAVQALTCCKDYLNDVVYAEKAGNILPIIYGFKYDNIRRLFKNKYFYLIIKILPRLGKDKLDDELVKDKDNLNKNYKNIEKIINVFEDKLGIKHTKITKLDNDYFVVKAPVFWVDTLYLFGLYTLLLRAYQYHNKENYDIEYLLNNPAYKYDNMMITSSKDKIKRILNGERPVQDYNKFNVDSAYNIHNQSGIVSFNF